MNPQLLNEISRNVEIALEEDRVFHDLTSRVCFPKNSQAEVKIFLKTAATVSGLPLLPHIAYPIDPYVEIDKRVKEGKRCEPETVLAVLRGNIHSLLSMERILLNFIQLATSISTKTAEFVEAVKGCSCDILDTRKTLPGLRHLQKYAVRMGGGKNHRFHLADQILIKDNHLSHLSLHHTSPITDMTARAKAEYPEKKIQVEVSDLKMFEEALKARPDAILLDNMNVEEVKKAVILNRGEIYLEASGKMNLQNIRSYAETGVNGISIGELTHSIKAVDISMKI